METKTQLALEGVGEPKIFDEDVVDNYLYSISDLSKLKVNSISGGKTSCYMYVKYPTVYNVFAIVLTKDPNCQIKDKGVLKDILNKCPIFEGSREVDQTLINILNLEQQTGRQIDWVYSDMTYDDLIESRHFLPNSRHRLCTEFLKMEPIYQWCKKTFKNELCEMNVGFRKDEYKRVYRSLGGVYRANLGWNWDKLGVCERIPNTKRYSEWRLKQFPLYSNNINKNVVIEYWNKKNVAFPEVSNCDYCFFHTKQEHLKQFEIFPDRSDWWIKQEEDVSKKRNKTTTFNGKASLRDILGKELDFNYDFSESSCFCTD